MKAFYESPVLAGRPRTSTALEGYLSLGYFLAPDTVYRDVFKLPPAHWLQLEGRPAADAAATGMSPSSTRTRETRPRSSRISMRCCRAAAVTSGSRARCRSARSFPAASIPAWSCLTWRRRWALGAHHRVGGLRATREHNELEAAGVTARTFRTSITTRPRRPARSRTCSTPSSGVRRAVCGLVGHSDLLRLESRAGARHGGASAATAATSRSRATTSATCRTRSKQRARRLVPGAPGRAALARARRGAWPRVAASAAAASPGTPSSRISSRDPADAYYARPVLHQAGGRAPADGARPGHGSADSAPFTRR